jgi:hypothetical protein
MNHMKRVCIFMSCCFNVHFNIIRQSTPRSPNWHLPFRFYRIYTHFFTSRGSSVSIVSGRPGFDPRQRKRIFSLPSASRPALGPTLPSYTTVTEVLSPGVKRGRGVMLTTHPLLVPRLRKSRSYTSCHPNAPLWNVTGPVYLFLYCNVTIISSFT